MSSTFPSEEQKLVILHNGRSLVVIAAPGTGKTRTIVARMIRLLKENANREVSFITFTRTSRKDTDKKIKDEVGKQALEGANSDFPRISTLHTYAKSIVHKYANRIGRNNEFSILIDARNEKHILLSELLEDLNIKMDIDRLGKDVTCHTCTGSFPGDCKIPTNKHKKVVEQFDILLRFYNTFDMEHLVQSACDILSSHGVELPSIFLQVDEYQDLNSADQKLIQLISSSKGSQVVVVGDDAQSIYKFRHAHPSGIRELWNSPDWEKIQFSNCHRLPPHILRAAQALISNEDYLGSKVKVPSDDGAKILTLQCTTSPFQIYAVAHKIKQLIKIKTNRSGAPLHFKDFMILCPNGTLVKNVANTLEKDFGIPTKQKEKNDIPEDHWRLLLVLRMLDSADNLALRQWLEIIDIPKTKISDIRRKAMQSGQSLFDYCSKLEIPAIKEIFTNLDKLQQSLNNLDLFRQALKDFPHLSIEDSLFPNVHITINEATKQPNSVNAVIRFIYEKFGLFDSEENIPDEDKTLVTTMYSAKGLEAEFVFIMWLNDNFIPASKKDSKEELRVLYVAITRAVQDVILTFYERFTGSRRLTHQAMSPFLKKIAHHLDIKRITKSELS